MNRYQRQIALEGWSTEGQARMQRSRVAIVGVGGLGSPISLYLAAAGVGTIGLVDGDQVDLTNLQRQVIHTTPDVGRPKVDSAEEKLKAINPDLNIAKHEIYLSEDNALELIRPYDYVIDGTDNFATKYLVNDACVMLGKSFCMGGISRYAGQVMTHRPGTACYRCLFPEPPAISDVETCATVGVLGSIAGMLGTVQATEAIKCLAGVGEPLYNALLTFDALTMKWQRFDFPKNEGCPLCGQHPTITSLKEYAFQPCSKKK